MFPSIGFRIYRVFDDGRCFYIEDFFNDRFYGLAYLEPTLGFVTGECRMMNTFYENFNMKCKHVIAVLRGWTVDYVEV